MKFKIPLDWLVIVGSYLSLTISIIGVKAKQSSSVLSNNQIEINRVQPPINFPSQIQQQTPIPPLIQQPPQQHIEPQFYQQQNINMMRPNMVQNQLLQQPLHHHQNLNQNQNQFKQFRYNQPNNNNNIRAQFNNQDGSFRQSYPYRNQTPNRFMAPNINNSNAMNQNINEPNHNSNDVNNNNGLARQDSSTSFSAINEQNNPNDSSLNESNPNENNNQTKSSVQNEEKDDSGPTESNIVKYYLDIDSSVLTNENNQANVQLDKAQIENYLNNDIFDPVKFQLDNNLKSIKNPTLTKYEHYLDLKSTYSFNDEYKILIKSYLNNSLFQKIFIKKQFEFDNQTCAKFLDDLLTDLGKNSLRSFQLFDGLFRSNLDHLNNLLDFLIYLINFHHSKAEHDFDDQEEEQEETDNNRNSDNEEEVVKSKKIKLDTHSSLKNSFKSKLIQIRLLKLAIKYLNLLLTKFDEFIATKLIFDKQIQSNLIHLLNSNKFISESINLKILNCLYNSLYFNCGMIYFTNNKNVSDQNETCYTQFLDYFVKIKNDIDKRMSTRLLFSLSTIIDKIQFFESLQLFALKCHRKYVDKISSNPVEEFIDLIDKIYTYSRKSCVEKYDSTLNNEYDILINEFNKLKKSINEEEIENEIENENENEVEEETIDEEIDNLFNKFNSYPLQNMFDSSSIFKNHGSIRYNHLLRLFDKTHIFKYLIVLWSNVQDLINKKSNSRLIHINNLIEQFLLNILTPSHMNNFSYNGLEYMLNSSNLSNTMINIMITKLSPLILKITYSLKILSLFDLLISNLNQIKSMPDFDLMSYLILESNDCLQTISLMLKIDYKNIDSSQTVCSYLSGILCGPDGNMSNKYVKCLIDWLEFLVDDRNLEIENEIDQEGENEVEDENIKLLNSSRVFMINSIGDTLYSLCKLNTNWGLPLMNKTITESSEKTSSCCFSDNLIRMNKLTSLLINNLVITKYRPSININQSYFLLLEKLKSIRTFIEQIVQAMTTPDKSLTKSNKNKNNVLIEKLATDLAIRSSYYYKITFLNNLIDSFQTNIDKNINLFFFRQFFSVVVKKPNQGMPNPHAINPDNIIISRKTQLEQAEVNLNLINKLKINYLNSSIAQLCLFKNLILNDDVGKDDLNNSYNRKFYLGHLISRNFLSILVNYISKMNDYLSLYFLPQGNKNDNNTILTFDLNQLDMVLNLFEPSIFLLKMMLNDLIKVRAEQFNDITALPVLFRFYGLFNNIIQTSLDKNKNNSKNDLNSKKNKLLHETITKSFRKINTNLLEIFASYTQVNLKFDSLSHTSKSVKEKLRSSLTSRMFTELARYTIDIPYNFIYGINLLLQLLPVPLPILVLSKPAYSENEEQKVSDLKMLNQRKILSDYLEPLFINQSLNSLNLSIEVNKNEYPVFVTMIRVLSLTTQRTRLNNLFRRICLKLSDISEKLCSYLLKTLLDYAIELFDNLKQNNDLIQIEVEPNVIGLTVLNPIENNANINNTTNNILEINDNDNNKIETNIDVNDDSIYDTDEPINSKIEQNGDSIDDETSKMLFDLNESTKEENQPIEQHQVNEQPNLNDHFENKNNAFDDFYLKSILNMNYSKLIKFIIDLLEYERKDCEINLIRTTFYHLMQESNNMKSKKLRNYSKFLTEFIKYTNHVDLNQTSAQNQTLSMIQGTCFSLIEAILRYLPNLFIDNLHQNNLEETVVDQAIFDSDIIIKSLFDHLTYNKIESIQTTTSVMNCLILLYKQYSLIKYHLKLNNTNSLLNFTHELNALIQNNLKTETITSILDLLAKFFIYLNLIIDDLSASSSIFKLKQLFKWSNTNTNELLIDSISTSNQTLFSNNQHGLINLDKSVESLQTCLNKDDTLMNKKYKFLFSHSKRLIKILNELEFEENTTKNVNLFSNIVNPTLKTEIDSTYSFDNIISVKNHRMPCKEDLKSFFFKRSVYKYVQDQNDLIKFERDWIDFIDNDEKDENTEINLDFMIQTVFNNWPTQMLSCLVKDENLFRILASSAHLEQQLDQLNQSHSDDIGDKTNGPQNNEQSTKVSDSSELVKKSNKNSEVINTRTGVRYKAPMRGGHNNAATRNNQTSNGNVLNNQGLMNPPTIIPQPNQSQIRHDSFRSRPPNTSRPPSVHVDDYYRLESQKQQQQQQQQNQINFNNQNQGIMQIEQAHINQSLVQF